MDEEVTIEEDGSEEPREVVRKLRERLKECTTEKQLYLEGWQRAKADFVNAQKAELKERDECTERAREQMMRHFIPLADHFERAFAQETWGHADESWRRGIESIYAELIKVMKKQGVEAAGAAGDRFDPKIHEPVGVVPVSEAEKDDVVLEVVERGYVMRERVIRPAKVKIGQLQDNK